MSTKIKNTEKKEEEKNKKNVVKKSAVKKVAVAKSTSPVEKIIYRFNRQFVFVPKCSNCDHVPMRINRLVALMTVLVVILSGMVIARSQVFDLNNLLVQAGIL
jgi:hypothetical protein